MPLIHQQDPSFGKNYTMKTSMLIALLSVLSMGLHAQSAASDLDFWIGEWDLKWADSDTSFGYGTNSIQRTLADQVIQENFQILAGENAGFLGKSWSVFDARTKAWKQTWVDSQGSYLDFTGGPAPEGFVFQRAALFPNGKTGLQKMVFYDITHDAFTWDWMRSTDGGETWILAWRIWYTRKK